MEIREILPWDRDNYLKLAHDFYRSSACDHPIPDEHLARTFDLLITGDTPYARCLAAADERGQLVAYLLMAITWSQEAGGLTVWLEELMIREDLRGQGLGTQMIEAAMACYPNAARFRLEVSESNTRAAALYARLGFTPLPYGQMILEPKA